MWVFPRWLLGSSMYIMNSLFFSFSLTIVVAVFMDIMNHIVKPFVDQFVIIFIDDTLIYFENDKEHANYFMIFL